MCGGSRTPSCSWWDGLRVLVVPQQERQLVEQLQQANLEIRFEERETELVVKYVTDEEETDRNKLLKSANLYDVCTWTVCRWFGHCSGLTIPTALVRQDGADRSDASTNNSEWRWNVTPQVRDVVIGR